MRTYSREWCDTVIPALGNRRPRMLVRTEAGRAKVLALIAEMESRPRPDESGGMDIELIRRGLDCRPGGGKGVQLSLPVVVTGQLFEGPP